MTTSSTPSAGAPIRCLRDVAGADPFPYYDALRRTGPISWDDSMRAWLVTDYANASYVLQHDALFNRADGGMAGGRAVRGDTRSLAVVEGDLHARLHRLLMGLLDRVAAASYRTSVIRPIADQLIDRFATRGRADLASEFADQLPIRVGLTLVGVGIDDEALVERIRLLKSDTGRWHETMGEVAEDTERAIESAAELKAIIMPFVRERKDRPRDDLISELWRTGPSVLPDWNEEDTYAGCLSHLGGGETQYALRNIIYLLLRQPELQQRVRADPDVFVPRLVEETLRSIGVVHWLARAASQDVELGGARIKQGDRVLAMIASANRDPDRFDRPDEVDLAPARRAPHLAFGLGARYCIGAALARAELSEAILALLSRFDRLELDDTAAPPSLVALRIRSFVPLCARFEPA